MGHGARAVRLPPRLASSRGSRFGVRLPPCLQDFRDAGLTTCQPLCLAVGMMEAPIPTHTGREHFPAAYADEARDWLADLEWADAEPEDIAGLSGRHALRLTRRHFDGGLSGFADAVWV